VRASDEAIMNRKKRNGWAFRPLAQAILILTIFLQSCVWVGTTRNTDGVVTRVLITENGHPQATIIIARNAGLVPCFAAQELQYHIKKITGAILPIAADDIPINGSRILIGESAATRALGLARDIFKPQEYLIRFMPNTIVLIGRDKVDTAQISVRSGKSLGPPDMFDEQGTCYAVYDFLERFCGVRWFAPTALGLIFQEKKTLEIEGTDIRRSPVFKFRQGPHLPVYGFLKTLWNNPTQEEVRLYACRMRLGGEAYTANHSFNGYYDRFWMRNPINPELFVEEHQDWFAQGYPDKPPQMCYTNPGFIKQVIKDARDYFNGKGAKQGARAAGDFFALVPMDEGPRWCKCPTCQAKLMNGSGSDYIFGFANEVAREIGKSHPDKYLSTLAYAAYADYPQNTRLEPNLSVQLCLYVRNWWDTAMMHSDMLLYRSWTTKEQGRPIYLWLYYCFPEEIAINRKFNCFPGFFAHTIDRMFKRFAHDSIRGVFLNNLGEYLDNYLTLKYLDDPDRNIDQVIDEFHRLYYGASAEPMKKIYLRIEEIYNNADNYLGYIQREPKTYQQTDEMAWGYLGTEVRMAELGKLMADAKALASTDAEKQRVALFEKGIWDYMVEGRKQWLGKKVEKKIH